MAEAKEQGAAAEGATIEASDFSNLLKKEFKPQTDRAKEDVEAAVKTLAEQALAGVKLVSNDVVKTINSMIAAIDRKLSDQINLIMHNDEFKKLEGAWRGLHHLVNNTETDKIGRAHV